MPKISVIIPVYNTADYLPICIESVCSQLFNDIEIICVNDCSTDNSLSVLKKYQKKDKRIKIINLKTNKGVSAARNKGIDVASGEYISFLDSDDYINNDFLLKLFETAENTNADIVKGNYLYEHDGYIAEWLNEKIREQKNNFSFDFCSAIYKTEMIKKNKIYFPEKYNDMEDPFFAFKASIYANKIKTVDSVYINIVKRRNSLTYGVPTLEKINIKYLALGNFIDFINKNSENINFDSYVFVTSFWVSNCFNASIKNKSSIELIAEETFEIIKKIKVKYYTQFKIELEKFGLDFSEFLANNHLNDLLLQYKDLNEKQIIPLKKDTIPIFLSSDENYAPFVAITIASICYNTNSFIDFYVLDGGISDFTKRQIETLKVKFNNFSVEYIEIDADKYLKNIQYKNICPHVSISTYNRFLIPDIKPDIKKALYLDVDLVALDDIKKLYDIELPEGYSLGAVPEYIEEYRLDENKKRMKLKKGHSYFNAGVLLIDCEQWRNKKIIKKLFKIEETKRDICKQADQDVLNIAFNNKYLQLSYKYNFMTNDLEHDVNKTKDIVIRHFNCKEKPWLYTKCEGKEITKFNEFWFFASLTPFYESLLLQFKIQEANNNKNEIMQKIIEHVDTKIKDIEIQNTKVITKEVYIEKPSKNALLEALRMRVKKDNKG